MSRSMRRGDFDEAELEEALAARGFLSRILGRVNKLIRRPGQMYPLGILFGLGFDTATEVALLVLAGTGAAAGLSVATLNGTLSPHYLSPLSRRRRSIIAS